MRDFAKRISTRAAHAADTDLKRQLFRHWMLGVVTGGVITAMAYTVMAISIVLGN
jgi:hypothetical protein